MIFIANKLSETPIASTPEQAIYMWKINRNFRALNGSNAAGREGNDAIISRNNSDKTSTIYFVHADFFVRLQNGIRG